MRELQALVRSMSHRVCHVLLEGEPGTGRQFMGRWIHDQGPLAAKPFVPIDLATVRGPLCEVELFGHARGYEGSRHEMLGCAHAAEGGTLYLRHVDQAGPDVQARLVECIEQQAVRPLGADRSTPASVRLIACTDCDLRVKAARGEFRCDLYERLCEMRLSVPPLRHRQQDIVPLAEHVLAGLAHLCHEHVKTLDRGLIEALEAYAWPGNVSELTRVINDAHAQCAAQQITLDDLSDSIRGL